MKFLSEVYEGDAFPEMALTAEFVLEVVQTLEKAREAGELTKEQRVRIMVRF